MDRQWNGFGDIIVIVLTKELMFHTFECFGYVSIYGNFGD